MQTWKQKELPLLAQASTPEKLGLNPQNVMCKGTWEM